MKNGLVGLVVCLGVSGAVYAEDNINYLTLRYTSFGVANPAGDRKVIDTFKHIMGPSKPSDPAAPTAAVDLKTDLKARQARIAELETQLKQKPSSRAEELRASARTKELERLKAFDAAPEPVAAKEDTVPKVDRSKVVVLVEALPSGVELKDGQLVSTDDTVELLGRFTAVSAFREDEAAFIEELRVLGAAAGGNIVVVSFSHMTEDQGMCHGGHGLVVRAPNFNEKKVTRTKLPSEI